jgi:D-glycero-D-manno-heptose 1,7-bisphosphate phosphatase
MSRTAEVTAIENRYIFLDRDGVINRKKPEGDYVTCWEEFEFLPRAKDALRLLTRAGYRLIIVTNQRGIARGVMSERDLEQIHERMMAELAQVGAEIHAIYYCPHDEGQCGCRKPETGLFWRAQRDFPDIDFACSLVIGDSLKDMEAGARLGCRNILIGEPSISASLVASARAREIAVEGEASSLFEAAVRYVI